MTLFREWSKYRYGVFPESGFQDGDRLYPHLYSEGNETKTNRGCIDDTMTPYCPLDGSYNRRAPTKQNLLCKERSALETILSHPDFKREDENATEISTGYAAPKFTYFTPAPNRVSLVLERTAAMGVNGRWTRVRRALFRLLQRLPQGTEVRYVTQTLILFPVLY